MPLEFEHRVVELVQSALGASLGETPDWLKRPGRAECLSEWDRVRRIYTALTQQELPNLMPPAERRKVDAVLIVGGVACILEVDERQHFNKFRAETIRHYTEANLIAFDAKEWLRLSAEKTKLEGGGFAKARPPLFPCSNGRHKQRAFRDALCDLLPPLHNYAPTIRINEYEAKGWIWDADAPAKLNKLLSNRFGQEHQLRNALD